MQYPLFVFFLVLGVVARCSGGEYMLPEPVGLVSARFSAPPPPGVHPRILISPGDLPGVRERLKNTEAGRRAFMAIEDWLKVAIGPGKPLHDAYEKLVAGDPAALDDIRETNAAWWKEQVAHTIGFEAFVAMINEDRGRGVRAGRALATCMTMSKTRGIAANLGPHIDDALGFAYDFAHPYMREEDRQIVRAIIAERTRGRSPFGEGKPAAHHVSNYMPHGMGLLLLSLAIEGEAGYNADIYPESVRVMRNVFEYYVDAKGDPLEDTHYFNFGMHKGAPGMIAMARRGDNLFASPHYRRLPAWYAQTMEPFGQAFSMHDDTPDDQGGLLPNYMIMKWVWPDDHVLSFVWRNRARLDYSGVASGYRMDLVIAALFPSDWTPGPASAAAASPAAGRQSEAVAGAEQLGLPLSWMGDVRRLFIARDKWGADGMTLHVTTNSHQRTPSHMHADCLGITLSSLGRKWAVDYGFHFVGSQEHSVVLIDGKGQGYYAPPGRVVETLDDGRTALITGDAKYAYDWLYEFGNATHREDRKGFDWRPETSIPALLAIYREWVPKYAERPWEAPNTLFTQKAPYNVVQKAFRTALLRRGDRPYVLIVDDIRKDDLAHDYQWLLQVPKDLEIKTQSPGEVVLGARASADTRRLLVRMIDVRPSPAASETAGWKLITRSLETIDYSRMFNPGYVTPKSTGQCLTFTCRAIEPAFKVLLWPHRDGDALPKTAALTAATAGLTVAWPGQTDAYALTPAAGGHTAVRLLPR